MPRASEAILSRIVRESDTRSFHTRAKRRSVAPKEDAARNRFEATQHNQSNKQAFWMRVANTDDLLARRCEKGRQVQGPASAGSCSPWTTDVYVYVYVYARVPVAF